MIVTSDRISRIICDSKCANKSKLLRDLLANFKVLITFIDQFEVLKL